MNKLSIIVPIYNVEKYLKKCIDSILEQTYKNLEIILIDDGSTDNSGKICDEYENKDCRIKVIHKKNGGLSDARNYGISIATGDYLGFIDSDDVIDRDMYEILYEKITQYNADIAICGFKKFFEGENIEYKKSEKYEIYTSKEAIKQLLLDNLTNHAWNKLYNKKLFEDIRYPKGKNFEDIGTTYKLFLKSKKIINIHSECYGYLLRGNSITGKINEKSLFDQIELINCRFNEIMKQYMDLKEILEVNRCNYIYLYNLIICKFLSKEVFYNGILNNEYCFYKEKFKEYGIIKMIKNNNIKDKIFKTIFYFNRKLFFKLANLRYRGIKNEDKK